MYPIDHLDWRLCICSDDSTVSTSWFTINQGPRLASDNVQSELQTDTTCMKSGRMLWQWQLVFTSMWDRTRHSTVLYRLGLWGATVRAGDFSSRHGNPT